LHRPTPHTSPFPPSAPPTTEPSTLSLHDALPIWTGTGWRDRRNRRARPTGPARAGGRNRHAELRLHIGRRELHRRHAVPGAVRQDRKSTRLNSSHVKISYAVFCLKKKKKKK